MTTNKEGRPSPQPLQPGVQLSCLQTALGGREIWRYAYTSNLIQRADVFKELLKKSVAWFRKISLYLDEGHTFG